MIQVNSLRKFLTMAGGKGKKSGTDGSFYKCMGGREEPVECKLATL